VDRIATNVALSATALSAGSSMPAPNLSRGKSTRVRDLSEALNPHGFLAMALPEEHWRPRSRRLAFNVVLCEEAARSNVATR